MMKKVILSAVLSLFAASGAFAAQTDSAQSPAVCGMSFTAKGGGVQILLGHFVMRGEGVIKCRDFRGVETRMPVKVQLGGNSPVALRIAFGWFEVAGVASGIGYAKSPEELLGKYLTVGANGAFVVGGGANVAMLMKRNLDAATLNTTLQLERGIGVNVGFQSLTVTPATQK